MKNTELSEEPSVLPASENIRRRRLNRSEGKDILGLEDAIREFRKKEASKPLYLVRYE